jgi:hypothetical protein
MIIEPTAGEADGAPLSYLAPRKELQQQALDKADRWGADDVLPNPGGRGGRTRRCPCCRRRTRRRCRVLPNAQTVAPRSVR